MTSAEPGPSKEHIAITPGTLGGKPRIAGHRMSVEHIAIMHEDQGMTPAQIVDDLPTITLADVHAALAYYYDHQEAIRQRQAEGEARIDAFFRENPSLFQEKLRALEQDAEVAPR